jgi:hypothetical protein
MIEDTDKYWTDTATKLLKGRKIKAVRYMDHDEAASLGWRYRCVVIELDNGTLIYPSMDDEGNDAGALFTTDPKVQTLPVLRG